MRRGRSSGAQVQYGGRKPASTISSIWRRFDDRFHKENPNVRFGSRVDTSPHCEEHCVATPFFAQTNESHAVVRAAMPGHDG
jgi:hypothetical protein